MKILYLLLILTLFSCSDKIYRNNAWMIEIDLSKTKIKFNNKIMYDSVLHSNFFKFKLPSIHCSVENIDFQPEFRIFDKYLNSDTLDYRQISDTLYSYLSNDFELLSSMMCSDNYGQFFGYTVKGDNTYFYRYHLVKFDDKCYLIETISTLGTRREIDKDFKKLIKKIKP